MRLSWMTAALGLGLFVFDRVTGVPATADSLMTLVLFVMGLLSWALLKTRHYDGMTWMLVVFLFGIASSSAWFYGSVRTMNIVLIPMGLIAAGVFLSRRGMVWTTVAAIVLLGLLTAAEALHLFRSQPQFAVGWRTWMTQVACLFGVAAMMHLSRTHMRVAQQEHQAEAVQRLETQLDRDLEQERFANLFRSSPAPIYVQSVRTGTILEVNPAFEQAMGYTRGQVLGRKDHVLWIQDDRYQAFVEQCRRGGRTDWHSITGVGGDGRTVDLQICSDQDEGPGDGLRITALRVPVAAGELTQVVPPPGEVPSA